MTKQQLLEKIRSAVVNVCPELMDLTFGCKVALKPTTQPWVSDKFVVIENQGELARIQSLTTRTAYNTWVTESLLIVIGHPIGLPEILQTINKHIHNKFKTWVYLNMLFIGVDFDTKDELKLKNTACSWDLAKTFEDQELPTLEFLANIIDP